MCNCRDGTQTNYRLLTFRLCLFSPADLSANPNQVQQRMQSFAENPAFAQSILLEENTHGQTNVTSGHSNTRQEKVSSGDKSSIAAKRRYRRVIV